ncbi:MAG: hypothetical protein R3B13_37610 [Polyangiaceae bacterium]
MNRSDGPAIVIGLGAFGTEVATRLLPLASDGLVVLTASVDDTAKVESEALERARALFGLKHALGSADRSLFLTVVADLDEPGVAERVPELSERVGAALAARFSHILGRGAASRMTVAPVLVMSAARGGEPAQGSVEALRKLEALALAPRSERKECPVARVLLLEPQARRYELAGSELTSTVVSFLFLLLTTHLRVQEPLRSFFEPLPDQQRDQRVFASFGCATLELRAEGYVLERLCRDTIAYLRETPGDAAESARVSAERLIPSSGEIEARIRGGGESRADLLELLRAHKPRVDVPSVGYEETPETIRDVKFGWGWFDALQNTVSALVRRLDELEMDELSRVADERGHRLATELSGAMLHAIDESEARDARGHARALRLVERARAVAAKERKQLERALLASELCPFPEPTAVENALIGLRDESTRRPRPMRLAAFAALFSLLAGLFLQHVPKWIYLALITRRVPLGGLTPASGSMPLDGLASRLLDPPGGFLIMALCAGVLCFVILRRYRQQRHAALCAERDALEAAVERFLADALAPSVLGFYADRLELSLRAWALRALKQIERTLDREHRRLTALSGGLERLERQYDERVRASNTPEATDGGDLVFRRKARLASLDALYGQLRPTSEVFERTAAALGRPIGGLRDEAPRLFNREALQDQLRSEVDLSTLIVAKHLSAPVEDFVTEMFDTLGVPLEVREFDERSAERSYVFCPEWATPVLEDARNRGLSAPEPIVTHDPERVHVLVVRTALPLQAIAVTQEQP